LQPLIRTVVITNATIIGPAFFFIRVSPFVDCYRGE
jgi:hypothetical protein